MAMVRRERERVVRITGRGRLGGRKGRERAWGMFMHTSF